ncbi:MAG: ATP-binding protein [Piscinibacter sp.]|nr:ATP-binding protein [Piscinibacter sp.]
MSRAFVIGLLGAESTGKTTLASQLATALRAQGRQVAVVQEYLREFCDHHGRTPRADEQRGIAAEQTRRIEAAAQVHEIVVADTTALMIAVYSEQVFGDAGLYDDALRDHARCDLTLLTALDLPWQPDGLQRDGAHVRAPVDGRVRRALATAGPVWAVVSGQGDARLSNALAAVRRALQAPHPGPRWRWVCERCGDADCERHRLLPPL